MRNTADEQAFSSAIVCSSSNLRKSKFSQITEYQEERFFANVWVQLLLFINVYFSWIWLASNSITLYYEYFNLTTIHRVLSVILEIFWTRYPILLASGYFLSSYKLRCKFT
ncbi:hypothetical protein quinque_013749 [Culex quinquefasciatus]